MANQISGTQIQIDLTLQDSAGDPKDLTGATLYWRLTRHYSVPGVLVKDSDTVGGVSILNPPGTDGLVTVVLDVDDSLDLQGTYYHEIKADYGSDVERTWQLGTLVFNESSVGAD